MKEIAAALCGEKYGRWTLLYEGPKDNGGHRRYFCRCECGEERIVDLNNLKSGKTQGCHLCGRKRLDNYHGMSNSKTYSIWVQMIERCHNEKHKYYSYYGARGIHVCTRWKKSFKNFLEDMGEKPENLSIDRIDNAQGYCKQNCKWSTRKEQQNNRRNSINVGEVVNRWRVEESIPSKKYIIKCLNCDKNREIRACNFRRVNECNGGYICERTI